MAYIDTPTTDRGDTTNLTGHNIDFSFAQPFGSPSKNPAENLRNQMRGLRAGSKSNTQTMQTPRVRNTLLDKRNPPGPSKQEFTPLLKSARRKITTHQSIPEEKENAAIPNTPREFKSSFISYTPGLPVNSSMLDGDQTTNSMMDSGTPAALAASSSMYDSTPIPQMNQNGHGAVLEQGNVMTLRDQEAKLDQIQKDNFGLKLKIHYLEEALRKTGSEFHQATMKENVELKTAKFSLELEMKKQRKRLLEASQQMEDYKAKYEEYAARIKSRPPTEQNDDELRQLRAQIEDSRRAAEQREEEIEDMRRRLEDAAETAKASNDSEELQRLRDEIQDLEAEVRARERQVDERDDKIESLEENLKDVKTGSQDLEQLQQDLRALEEEAQTKDDEIALKDQQIQKLEQASDEAEEQIHTLQQHSDEAEEKIRTLQQHSEEVEEKVRMLQEDFDKAEEKIRVLQMKSGDAEKQFRELQQTTGDAPEHELIVSKLHKEVDHLEAQLLQKQESMDKIESERRAAETRFEEKLSTIENQLRSRTKELEVSEEQCRLQEIELQSLEDARSMDLREKSDSLRNAERELADKDGEIKALQERLQTARGSWDNEAKETDARLQERDSLIQQREARLRDVSRLVAQRDEEAAELKSRLRRAESDQHEHLARQTKQLREQTERVRDLQEELRSTKALHQARIYEKDGLIEAGREDLRKLKTRLDLSKSDDKTEMRRKEEQCRGLEMQLKQKEATIKDQERQIASISARFKAMETPSRKDSLIKQQAEQVRTLHQQLQQLEERKEQELDELDQQLQEYETDNAELRQKIQELTLKARDTSHDQSLIGHKDDDLRAKQNRIYALEEELEKLRARLQTAVDKRQADIQSLERDLDMLRKSEQDDKALHARQMNSLREELTSKYAKTQQEIEDEMLVLETNLEECQSEKSQCQRKIEELEGDLQRAQHNETLNQSEQRSKWQSANIERDSLKATITSLESRLDEALQGKAGDSFGPERTETQRKLRDAEARASQFQRRIDTLERDLEAAQQEKTLAEERIDLHEMLRQSKIEAEQLQITLGEKEVKLKGSATREAELRARVASFDDERGELHSELVEVRARLQLSVSKEKELKTQLRALKDTGARLEELEQQLGDKQDSSNSHAKKESELRSQLRDMEAALEALRLDAEEKALKLQTVVKKERDLRDKLRKARAEGSQQRDLHLHASEAETELQALQQQLRDRAIKLRSSLKREQNLRDRVASLEQVEEGERTIVERQLNGQLAIEAKRHEAEIKGLVRQIQYLRARCSREESFRNDLVYTKKWFLMQVDMYNQCNQADLRLLEEIGITPDVSFREKRPSFKTVGLMVVATVRMKKMQASWAGHQKVHESLLKKLDSMKRISK